MSGRMGWLRAALVLALGVGAAAPATATTAQFRGTLGRAPVTVQLQYENRVVRGLYFYDRYRTPIALKATVSRGHTLEIDETDVAGLPSARLRFQDWGLHPSRPPLTGTWTDYRTRRQLPLHLELVRHADYSGVSPPGAFATLQLASTDAFYFQVPGGEGAVVTAIEVMDKATGTLSQRLDLPTPHCNRGMHTVEVALEQGETVLRLPPGPRCPGTVFRWNPRAGGFERVSP
ncbi:hypothetical protein [Coralloluteibacterium thermophilus]|uniref:DUF3108 domain-containing protein n=1 Tax=Coralloluteibacterium thermophilum TaxID=2707049 RepID=A0ABV9NGG8_9GAMM